MWRSRCIIHAMNYRGLTRSCAASSRALVSRGVVLSISVGSSRNRLCFLQERSVFGDRNDRIRPGSVAEVNQWLLQHCDARALADDVLCYIFSPMLSRTCDRLFAQPNFITTTTDIRSSYKTRRGVFKWIYWNVVGNWKIACRRPGPRWPLNSRSAPAKSLTHFLAPRNYRKHRPTGILHN